MLPLFLTYYKFFKAGTFCKVPCTGPYPTIEEPCTKTQNEKGFAQCDTPAVSIKGRKPKYMGT